MRELLIEDDLPVNVYQCTRAKFFKEMSSY